MPSDELDRRALDALLAFEPADRFFEHGGVHLEADGVDVAALLAAEQVAGAADFEVERGDPEAGAEVAELLDRGEAAAGDLGELLSRAG